MNRTVFLVDGFNLYHSLRQASADLDGASTRWLDLRSFCASYLSEVGGGAVLHRVIYFSAIAWHREATDPGVAARHLRYVECLRATGVEVELGQFKRKRTLCPRCLESTTRHEEKETDVAIGVRLVELLWLRECEAIVVVSGDNDLAPALRSARRHFPDRPVCCCFPYQRIGFELRALASKSFRARAGRYLAHQLPDPFRLADGRTVSKPSAW